MRMIGNEKTQTPAPIFEAPTAGAYIVGITEIENHDSESYLGVKADILEGPYKGFYTRWRDEHPDWRDPLTFRKYYTAKAVPFFRGFCNAVSRSNGNFTFDGDKINHDERTLVGKRFGVVLRAVEYYTNSGDLRTRLEIFREIPVDQVPYQPVPQVLTIAKQEELKARRAARQGTPALAPAYTQPAQAFAQQAPTQTPAYVQLPAQAQTATPAYTQAQQSAQAPAYAQFVDVSGNMNMEEMPFM